jgi:excisionase family DNA binding protein
MRGMDKQLYTTNEAAELLGVTPARVRQMVARDEIESEKMGRDRFITAQAIAAARQRKTSPGPVPKSAPATPKLATGHASAKDGVSTGGKKGRERKQGAK